MKYRTSYFESESISSNFIDDTYKARNPWMMDDGPYPICLRNFCKLCEWITHSPNMWRPSETYTFSSAAIIR